MSYIIIANHCKKIIFFLFLTLASISLFSQDCEVGAGVIVYYQSDDEIYLLLADHIKEDQKERGWSSFGGTCDGDWKETAIDELFQETRGLYEKDQLRDLLSDKDAIRHTTLEGGDFVTYFHRVEEQFDINAINARVHDDKKHGDKEREPYHVFRLSELKTLLRETPESQSVKLSDTLNYPRTRPDGRPTQDKLYAEFVTALRKALVEYTPFMDTTREHKPEAQAKTETSGSGDGGANKQGSGGGKDGGNNGNKVKNGDSDDESGEKTDKIVGKNDDDANINRNRKDAGNNISNDIIYKKVVIRKDGYILTRIPEYDYREKVYIEINGVTEEAEANNFVLYYKHLEWFDQPYAIGSPDGVLWPEKIGDYYYFIVPSFSKGFRQRKGVGLHESYEKSKVREAYLTYNLLIANAEESPCEESEDLCLQKLKDQIKAEDDRIKPVKERSAVLSKLLTQAKVDTAKNDPVMITLTRRIDSLDFEVKKIENEIKIFEEKIAIAVDKIALFKATAYEPSASIALDATYDDLQNLKVDSLRKVLEKSRATQLKSARTKQKNDRRKALEAIIDDSPDGKTQKELQKQIDESDEKIKGYKAEIQKITAHVTYEVVKIGGIVLGNDSKTISYELGYRTKEDDKEILDLKRMGNFPTMTEQDHLYASIINRIGYVKDEKKLEEQNYNIRLSINEIDSPLYTPGPVRPSSEISDTWAFNSGKERVLEDRKPAKVGLANSVYQDLILPMGKMFRRGRILEVEFKADSYTFVDNLTNKDTTDDGTYKLEDKVLLEEKYPQIRGVYRFNLTSGFIGSFVERSSFTKIRNTNSPDSDPTYFIRKSVNSDPKVFPIVALTAYWRPVNFRAKANWTEMIPNPMVAFDFRDPTGEIFLGAASEFLRNLQILYGFHYSKVDVLGSTQDLTDAAAPNVEKRFKKDFFIGLSFNFNIVPNFYKDFFKKPDGSS